MTKFFDAAWARISNEKLSVEMEKRFSAYEWIINLTVELQKLENLNSHHEIFRSFYGRVTIVYDDESYLLFPNDDS